MKQCSICKAIKEDEEFRPRTWKRKDGGVSEGFYTYCIPCDNARKKENQRTVKYIDSQLRRYYNIGYNDYMAMHIKQGGACKICRNPETAIYDGKTRRLAVDHCHDTGRVRGLLCQSCNHMIGNSKDRIDILAKGIEYLTIAESEESVGKERRDE